MKILMLDSSTYGEDVNVDKFYGLGEVKSYQTSTRQEALERTAGFNPDVVIINKIVADKEFIDCAPALKMIAETATGYNNIDINYAKEKNIRVANVAGYSTDSVVQHTFALGLYLIEKMNYYDNYVKSGEYAECPIFSHFSNVFHELSGKTWGIVGLGTIGKGVAKIASDFGCKVIYYSASGKTQDVPYEREEFDEFLKKSDIISIHAPLNDKTNNLFNKEAFDMMQDGTIIINCARDVLVDEAAIGEALKSGRVKTYVSDFPNPTTAKMEGAIVLPHLGASTAEAEDNCAIMAVNELRNFIENGNIVNSVNYPNCDCGVCATKGRITVCHKNVPTVISKITTVLGAAGINISSMANQSRGDYAYSLLDIEASAPEAVVEELSAIEGVIKVRVIK